MRIDDRWEARLQQREQPRVVEAPKEQETVSKLAGDARYTRATELVQGIGDYGAELRRVMRGQRAETPALQEEIARYAKEMNLPSEALAAHWLKGEWIAEAREQVDTLLVDPTLPDADRRALRDMQQRLYREAMSLNGNRHEDAAEAA